MILIDSEILLAQRKGDLEIEPFDAVNIQPNSYDLTLGDEFIFFTNDKEIDPRKPCDGGNLLKTEHFLIHPGEFLLATTQEKVTLPPDICGMLMGRSSFARLGLEVHQTAGWVDAGFSGTLTLELVNNNRAPIILRKGDRVAQIVFFKTNRCTSPYGFKGKYQDQDGVTPSRVHRDYR